ncbi:MAG: T9SS type A sorting domain-containing protein, partial [Flavobacteriales bacterium]|nr:T9SS type A sorting domain-containing protein [Flavobacteriales bacterium]
FGAVDCVSIVGPSEMAENGGDENEHVSSRIETTEPQAMVYPNPCDGNWVSLHLEALTSDVVTVTIFDMTGNVVHREVVFAVEGELNATINFINRLAGGTYNVELRTENERITKRLVITG